MTGEFMVIGLGRFGRALALSLVRQGQAVLAVDADRDRVQAVASEVDAVICADATDEAVLADLHPERATCAIVAIGTRGVEASILVTTLLSQAGVPRIVARAVSELHARVLRAVGAHQIINPEAEIGERLARRLAQPNVLEQLDLGDDVDLAELTVPEAFVGRSLIELDLRRRHAVSVLAIRRKGRVRATLDGTESLESGDVLVLIGTRTAISAMASRA